LSNAKKISAIIFFLVITVIPLLILILPKKEFSENENRVLTPFPNFTWDNIQSGKFMKDFEGFFSDHFMMRDEWIATKTQTELLAGKKEVNGVFVLNDRLIQKVEDYDRTLVAKNVSAINGFAKRVQIPCTMMLVPTACEIQKDQLDPNVPVLNQKMLIESVYSRMAGQLSTVDVYTPLYSSKDEYIYYKTDHHWTSLGAYLGYSAASKSLGYQTIPLNSFNIQHASHDFYGTLYSKVIYDKTGPDTIDYYSYPKGTTVNKVVVSTGSSEKYYDSMYFREYLSKKDKYSSFLGNNQPFVTVHSNAKSGKKLLVIKDSYAHSLVPFLTQHYSEITMVDLRYINVDLNEKLKLNDYDQVLFVYNVETFAEDQNIVKLNFTE
jgi:hypothetical protein